MPISAAMFSSERKNPEPQCPPRLVIQVLTPVTWSRMPNEFLAVETTRLSERQGWAVECNEPLVTMALHIPEENRSGTPQVSWAQAPITGGTQASRPQETWVSCPQGFHHWGTQDIRG